MTVVFKMERWATGWLSCYNKVEGAGEKSYQSHPQDNNTKNSAEQLSRKKDRVWRKDGENMKRDVLFHYIIGLKGLI